MLDDGLHEPVRAQPLQRLLWQSAALLVVEGGAEGKVVVTL